jgi:hypothetical protein
MARYNVVFGDRLISFKLIDIFGTPTRGKTGIEGRLLNVELSEVIPSQNGAHNPAFMSFREFQSRFVVDGCEDSFTWKYDNWMELMKELDIFMHYPASEMHTRRQKLRFSQGRMWIPNYNPESPYEQLNLF